MSLSVYTFSTLYNLLLNGHRKSPPSHADVRPRTMEHWDDSAQSFLPVWVLTNPKQSLKVFV